tara:strand:+ start:1893 stop:2672 length:780 start_codon:yes stop_codon:yes gene_type:complete
MFFNAYGFQIHQSNKFLKNDTIINCEFLKKQEFLKYNIRVGLVTVGKVNFRKSFCEDSKLINAEIVGYTKGLGKLFFDLNVNYESYFMDQKYTPIKFIKSIYENGNKKQEEIFFNNKLKKAYYRNTKDTKGKIFFYKNKVFDLVSAIYLFRSKTYNINKYNSKLQIPYLHNGNGIKKLRFDFVGIDTIKISNTLIKTKKYLCNFDSKNKLFQNKSEVYFWVSDDKYNIPIKIETRTKFSKIKIELINYTGQTPLEVMKV